MINTESLTLVPLDIKYSKDLFQLWSDYEVVKYTYTKLLSTKEECDNRVKLWVDNHTDKEVPNNLVVLLEGKAIGIVGFPIINKEKSEFGFFYQFAREYWGKGYAIEGAKALLGYIISNYPDANIYADVVEENIASIYIIEKLGFKQIKVDKNGFEDLDLIHFEYGGSNENSHNWI